MRVLGIDFGSKRIGLAISDETNLISSTIGILDGTDLDSAIHSILEKVKEYNVGEIVVGLPLALSGRFTEKTKEVEVFINALESATYIPIRRWDERLSTVQAEGILCEAGLTRKKRKKYIDSLSAQIILQSYLDFNSGRK